MKSITIVNKIHSHHKLASTHSTTDIQQIKNDILNNLPCTNIPTIPGHIQWESMNKTTLGSTMVWFNTDNSLAFYNISINSLYQWHHGQCSNKPIDRWDLRGVILHEILHGMGFLSTISSNKVAFPIAYDLLLKDSAQQPVVTDTTFTRNFGDFVHINNIRIYNPVEYDSGTSLSHVHDSGKIMSGFMSTDMCTQKIDHSTKTILDKLGYGCSGNVLSPQTPQPSQPPHWVMIMVIVIIVLICCVMGKCCINNGKRQRRNISPPLTPKHISYANSL